MERITFENLRVMIRCYYFQHHTSHHNFINIDLRERARRILIARRDPYEPSEAVEAVRHLLPPFSRELVDMENRLPPMEHPYAQEPAAPPDQQILEQLCCSIL